jgi:hypothetical protein
MAQMTNETSVTRTSKTIGTMVWCQSCQTVVWALDRDVGDLRGTLNMLNIPCRLCGSKGNYDGHNATISHQEWLGTFDGWSTMKALAKSENVEWNPSETNIWFDSESDRSKHEHA